MATFDNGESGLSVRNKINAVLPHADGTAGELVINDAGADVDFRVESDTNANAFFVDGASGNVGIGATPSSRLHVSGGDINLATNATYVRSVTSGGTDVRMLGINASNIAYVGPIDSGPTTTIFSASTSVTTAIFNTSGTEKMRIDASGNVGIGTAAPSTKLEVIGNLRLKANTTVEGAFQQISFPAGIYEKAAIRGISTGTTDSGALAFLTAPPGDLVTERLRIDASGNLGLGVVPSAWRGDKAAQLPWGAVSSGYEYSINVASVAYRDNANWRYQVTGQTPARYEQLNGTHRWYVAPSGTAGTTITFTQAMTLDASGNLGIGTTSPGQRLDIQNAAFQNTVLRISSGSGTTGNFKRLEFTDNAGALVTGSITSFGSAQGSGNDYAMTFTVNAAERMRIDSNGNVLIGTATSGASRLRISGLPTSSAGLSAGDVWNDGGTLKIA